MLRRMAGRALMRSGVGEAADLGRRLMGTHSAVKASRMRRIDGLKARGRSHHRLRNQGPNQRGRPRGTRKTHHASVRRIQESGHYQQYARRTPVVQTHRVHVNWPERREEDLVRQADGGIASPAPGPRAEVKRPPEEPTAKPPEPAATSPSVTERTTQATKGVRGLYAGWSESAALNRLNPFQRGVYMLAHQALQTLKVHAKAQEEVEIPMPSSSRQQIKAKKQASARETVRQFAKGSAGKSLRTAVDKFTVWPFSNVVSQRLVGTYKLTKLLQGMKRAFKRDAPIGGLNFQLKAPIAVGKEFLTDEIFRHASKRYPKSMERYVYLTAAFMVEVREMVGKRIRATEEAQKHCNPNSVEFREYQQKLEVLRTIHNELPNIFSPGRESKRHFKIILGMLVGAVVKKLLDTEEEESELDPRVREVRDQRELEAAEDEVDDLRGMHEVITGDGEDEAPSDVGDDADDQQPRSRRRWRPTAEWEGRSSPGPSGEARGGGNSDLLTILGEAAGLAGELGAAAVSVLESVVSSLLGGAEESGEIPAQVAMAAPEDEGEGSGAPKLKDLLLAAQAAVGRAQQRGLEQGELLDAATELLIGRPMMGELEAQGFSPEPIVMAAYNLVYTLLMFGDSAGEEVLHYWDQLVELCGDNKEIASEVVKSLTGILDDLH